jgi:hypothetical protein
MPAKPFDSRAQATPAYKLKGAIMFLDLAKTAQDIVLNPFR